MWQLAFVATSAALGEPLAAIESSLDEQAARAGALLDVLRTEGREARARAMAQHLAAVASDLGAMEPTW